MGDLCGAWSLGHLLDKLRPEAQDAGMFASWNVRWITDALT